MAVRLAGLTPRPRTFGYTHSSTSRRVLVYKCIYTNNVIGEITKFFSDGTFKYKDIPLPLFYCFLPGKSATVYMEVFKVLKSYIGNKRIIGMALDLKLSVINILKELFGNNVHLRLCFFHLRCRLSAKERYKLNLERRD